MLKGSNLRRVFLTTDVKSYISFLSEALKENKYLSVVHPGTADNPSSSLKYALSVIKAAPEVYLDIETTHTDPYCGVIVLSSVFVKDVRSDFSTDLHDIVFTFDHLTIPIEEVYSTELFKNTRVVAHNLMFETLWFLKHKVHFRLSYCTMLTEQKLLQGSGLRFNLIDCLKRRGVLLDPDMDKQIRADFNSNYTQHQLKYILYNQSDTICLHPLKEAQASFIQSQGLTFYLYQIHFPLIRVLALAQLEGLVINEDKFIALAEKAEAEMKGYEKKMNDWLTTTYPGKNFSSVNKPFIDSITKLENKLIRLSIRSEKHKKLVDNYIKQDKTHLKAYKFSSEMLAKTTQEELEVVEQLTSLKSASNVILWSSSAQVISLLQEIGCTPMPMAKDKKTGLLKCSLGKAPREKWLLKHRGNEIYPLMQLYDTYMKVTKQVNSFGKSFLIKYKHPVTGRFHTSYKQGTVATGRLASGDSKAAVPKFNSQQLPRLKALRECFGTVPGYLIDTHDLSSAELITMCSLANDQNLFQIYQKGDMHSYFANKGWKAIYGSRGEVWSAEDEISSTQNKDKRTKYKPMLFGTVYGLGPPKAAETLNVTEAEGAIAINTIISEIPATITMVKQAIQQALLKGYVVHNNRTYSRRWFTPVIEAKNANRQLTFKERQEVEGGARNTRIQGTQADMLCESMVTLQRFIDLFKLDAVILMQVHDEIVVKFKESYKDWFPEAVRRIMTNTANKYLSPGIQMQATGGCLETWTKD